MVLNRVRVLMRAWLLHYRVHDRGPVLVCSWHHRTGGALKRIGNVERQVDLTRLVVILVTPLANRGDIGLGGTHYALWAVWITKVLCRQAHILRASLREISWACLHRVTRRKLFLLADAWQHVLLLHLLVLHLLLVHCILLGRVVLVVICGLHVGTHVSLLVKL
jgi:hypothetical protein